MTNCGVKRVISAGVCVYVCVRVFWGVAVGGEFEVVPWTLSAGWLQAPPRRMLGAELPHRPTEAFSWRTFRSWGSTMALCVSEPTRLPLHISRGMGGGFGEGGGGRSSQISSISAGRPTGKQHSKLLSCLQPLYGAIFGASWSMLLNETLQTSGWRRSSEPT